MNMQCMKKQARIEKKQIDFYSQEAGVVTLCYLIRLLHTIILDLLRTYMLIINCLDYAYK